MTDLRKAAEMALEALEGIHVGNMTPMAEENWNKAIKTLRTALAQPEQEPVAFFNRDLAAWLSGRKGNACTITSLFKMPSDRFNIPLYTAPPKQWVGLTEYERNYYNDRLSVSRVAEDIEFELRSRNEKN